MIVERGRNEKLTWADHVVQVPVDHSHPSDKSLSIFAREVRAIDDSDLKRPTLLFLQGGPGHRSDRPKSGNRWLARAVQDYRVILMDSRGTGRSSPVTSATLCQEGNAQQQARHLALYRADSIVSDSEMLRKHLLGTEERWSLLGQSFGGWCATTYLSMAPDFLDAVLITGGLPSLSAGPDDVYRASYPRVLAASRSYFETYPTDRSRLTQIAETLESKDIRLPRGERLTRRRLQGIGIALGLTNGPEAVHFIVEDLWDAVTSTGSPEAATGGLDEVLSHAGRPLFALLQEATYCQGTASNWAAHRIRASFPEVDADEGTFFTGEMIYPWMYDEDPTLVAFGEVAEELALLSDWPPLYDAEVLASNQVPVQAVIYSADLFVDVSMSFATASGIANCQVQVSEDAHDGLRTGDVLDRMLANLNGAPSHS